jgi:hypothetical protein
VKNPEQQADSIEGKTPDQLMKMAQEKAEKEAQEKVQEKPEKEVDEQSEFQTKKQSKKKTEEGLTVFEEMESEAANAIAKNIEIRQAEINLLVKDGIQEGQHKTKVRNMATQLGQIQSENALRVETLKATLNGGKMVAQIADQNAVHKVLEVIQEGKSDPLEIEQELQALENLYLPSKENSNSAKNSTASASSIYTKYLPQSQQ